MIIRRFLIFATVLGSFTVKTYAMFQRRMHLFEFFISLNSSKEILNNICFRFNEKSDWGLYANRKLRKNELVCSIPYSKLRFQQKTNSHSLIFDFAYQLLDGRRNGDLYIKSLPWNSSPNETHYDKIITDAFEGSDEENYDFQLFRSAVLIVLSRIHKVRKQLAMVPFCDMFNFPDKGKQANVDCSLSNFENFSCYTIKDVEKGGELLVNYRDQSGDIADEQLLKQQWNV